METAPLHQARIRDDKTEVVAMNPGFTDANARLAALVNAFATFRASATPLRTRVPRKIRIAAVEAVGAGISPKEVAAACGLPRGKIQSWVRQSAPAAALPG